MAPIASGWDWLLEHLEAEPVEAQPDEAASDRIDQLVYADPPEGFGDPIDEASRLERIVLVRRALWALPRAYRSVIARCFGLDGAAQTPEVYALEQGLSRRTAYLLLDEGKRRLARRLKGVA